MNDAQLGAAVRTLVAQATPAWVTDVVANETANVQPVKFPTKPDTLPPDSYSNGTPTRNAAEAVDRARYGMWVDGVGHQTQDTVNKLWLALSLWSNEILKASAAQFSDPDLFFVLYMNGRINCEDPMGNATSLSAFRPDIVKMSVAEWLDSLPPAGGGIYVPPQNMEITPGQGV